jgi:hypothetical protein
MYPGPERLDDINAISRLDEAAAGRIFREESGRSIAALVRAFGDIDLAENAVQEAFAVALRAWGRATACRPTRAAGSRPLPAIGRSTVAAIALPLAFVSENDPLAIVLALSLSWHFSANSRANGARPSTTHSSSRTPTAAHRFFSS